MPKTVIQFLLVLSSKTIVHVRNPYRYVITKEVSSYLLHSEGRLLEGKTESGVSEPRKHA